jgi:transcriptional regulator with XRE-family HTH domain
MAQKATELLAFEPSTHTANPIDAHVGARVRMHRLLLRVKLDALAGSIGVTVFAMRDYELGVSRISAEHLRRICRALEAPPSFFFESGSGCSGRRRGICG